MVVDDLKELWIDKLDFVEFEAMLDIFTTAADLIIERPYSVTIE